MSKWVKGVRGEYINLDQCVRIRVTHLAIHNEMSVEAIAVDGDHCVLYSRPYNSHDERDTQIAIDACHMWACAIVEEAER